jgi:hypothetical protein
MSLCKSLFLAVAMLAYLGQSLAFAGDACDAMGDTAMSAEHMMPDDAEHMHHEMAAQTEQVADCCDAQCPCIDQSCQSPVPAIAASNNMPLFRAVPIDELRVQQIIRSSFYLYKPPILS